MVRLVVNFPCTVLLFILPRWTEEYFCFGRSRGKDHSIYPSIFFVSYALINVKPLGGRPGKGGGFDCNHRPVVGFFDRFNDLSSNILLTFGCYFDNPQCSEVGHLNENSQLSSNAPPMPGLPPPPQRLNIDRCITDMQVRYSRVCKVHRENAMSIWPGLVRFCSDSPFSSDRTSYC